MAREKRRNSEKRKEKSRDAARCRRSKETEIFTELAECLPLPENISLQLDKASVMRLAICLLKIGNVLDVVGITDMDNRNNRDNNEQSSKGVLAKKFKEGKIKNAGISDQEDKMKGAFSEGQLSQFYLKALEGTIIILSCDGDFVYLSENVAKYLGLQQIEMMGQSIYDYIHPCDHEEIKNALNAKTGRNFKELPKQQPQSVGGSCLSYSDPQTFSIRMKCTLATKGRSVNFKSAPYKVMKCSGRIVSSSVSEEKADGYDNDNALFKPYLLAMIEPIPHPSNIEVPLDSSTFLSKHEMDMRFVFCDERIEELAGYDHTAMVGQSFFDFHHALDSEDIKKTFKDLFSKGQAMTSAYRMLAANGGYIWLVTQATTINSSRNQKPQSVVCVHYVLSDVEEKGAILSNIQQDQALLATPITETKTEMLSPLLTAEVSVPLTDEEHCLELPPKLELSTESIFSPKTKDMDKALCRPPDLVPYLTDDPDDMSCLSPTAGDENIQVVPFSACKTDYLTSPMLPMVKSPPEIIRMTGLLSPDQYNGTECSRTTTPVDYMSCVMPLELEPMEKLFSPMDNTTSAGSSPANMGSDSPPALVGTKLEVEELMDEDIMDIDFAMRAPYIPMDRDQDLDLLPPSTSTLFNLSKDDIDPSVFGRTEYVFGPKETLLEDQKPPPKRNVRDMLGESTAVASIEQPPEIKYLQMKRTLDMNCLEKGPPVSKVAKLEQLRTLSSISIQPCQNRGVNPVSGTGNKNSVLLNLLLTGEDSSYGYRVSQKPFVIASSAKTNCLETNSLETLTSQDYEVNAPIQSCKLLQGQELLSALDP